MDVIPVQKGYGRIGVPERSGGPQTAKARPQNQGLRLEVVHRLALVGAVLAAAGCAARGSQPVASGRPASEAYPAGWTEIGVASWYGEPFHGRRTASGEVYDMDGPTAAHRTLPFGTRIRVENRDNDRSVELIVNDRGPFAKGRILDVSRAGARALGMIGAGTARVRITVLEPGGDAVSMRGGCVVVQIAAYQSRQSAEAHEAEVARAGFAVRIERHDGWYRVIAGPYDDPVQARSAAETLDGFIRRC